MQVDIELTFDPIDPTELAIDDRRVGAWVEFRGQVRGTEAGKPIAALEYEAYTLMAERQIRRILSELGTNRPCVRVLVKHRLGIIPVGETAIWVAAGAAHRREAFQLVTRFIDRLKEDVPIWKCRALDATSPAEKRSLSK